MFSKKIGELEKTYPKKNNLLKIFVVIFCIVLVGYFGRYILKAAQIVGSQIGKGAVTVVSNSFGKEMTKDEFGNINIMIVGYGGIGHAGSFLTDSIMVASRNPKLGAVTMLSVPRDLYVIDKKEGIRGRINEIFAVGVGRKHEYETGARYLEGQLESIMGLSIDYYALVDFQGFEGIIDSLGGIDIYVEKPIVDTTYPGENNSYITFKVGSGLQHFDGKTALMYARSRHSTSDFSRSLRQQQIVQAVMQQLSSKDILLSPSKIKELYGKYIEMVKTNITMDEMIGMSKYAYNLKHIHSFGYTMECSHSTWRLSTPGCFLYAPPRELFNGAAVIIPVSPTGGDPTYYEYTAKFATYVMHNQGYLAEDVPIVIQNGIDKAYAKSIKKKSDGFANKIAVKLNKFAFNVIGTENAKQILTGTTAYILGTGDYEETIDTLRYFMPITTIVPPEMLSGEVTNITGAEMVIVLGNDYLDKFDTNTFSYYR